MKLYTKENIDTLPWPNSECGQKAKQYLLPLMKGGVEQYVANVKAEVFVVCGEDFVLPLTITETSYNNSYVASNFYIIEQLKEWLKGKNWVVNALMSPVRVFFGGVLKGAKINQMVMVNNWFYSTNLFPELSEGQIKAINQLLIAHFPRHMIMWRNVNTLGGSTLYEGLQKAHLHLFKTREVFIYDPAKKENLSTKALSHHRKDFKLLEKWGYTLVRRDEIALEEVPRILELYRKVYLDKHTQFSPQYTEKFLTLALQNGFLDLVALKKEGKIDAVMGFVQEGKMVNAPFVGYDTNLPYSGELYRMLTIVILKEAEARNRILNDSSGASEPKKYRGLKPATEYTATYFQHLPLARKFFWGGCFFVMGKILFPIQRDK